MKPLFYQRENPLFSIAMIAFIVVATAIVSGCEQPNAALSETALTATTQSDGENAAAPEVLEGVRTQVSELTTQLEEKTLQLQQSAANVAKLQGEVEKLNYRWNSNQEELKAAGEQLIEVQKEFDAIKTQTTAFEQRIIELRTIFAKSIDGLEATDSNTGTAEAVAADGESDNHSESESTATEEAAASESGNTEADHSETGDAETGEGEDH